jgi:hypothetical protein
MGQFSVEKPVLPGSVLSGNQQAAFVVDWISGDLHSFWFAGSSSVSIGDIAIWVVSRILGTMRQKRKNDQSVT